VEPTARFERACELGDGAGCRERGRQLRGVYEGYLCDTGSEGWYERGAELGDAGSWSDLGYWREVCPKDLAAARAAYRRACELSDTAGCDHLADLDRRKPAGRAPKGNRP
jgi:TPR repeat protein